MKEWLTTGDAATFLGIHVNTIRRWADAGLIPYYVVGVGVGGHRRFRRYDLLRWLDKHRGTKIGPKMGRPKKEVTR